MSNIFVEGFGTYGVTPTLFSSAVKANLLTRWAAADNFSSLSTLPWDPTNTDLFLGGGAIFGTLQPFRVVLPSTYDTVLVSGYFGMAALPPGNDTVTICTWNDGSNYITARLMCQSTGAWALYDGNNTLLVSTSGPVLSAAAVTSFEAKLTVSTGVFQLNINTSGVSGVGGTTVISASGLTFKNSNRVTSTSPTAQMCFNYTTNSSGGDGTLYLGNLIIRNTSGTYNTGFLGDRRVATLYVNADDSSHQGWTANPRKRFGTGILDNRANTNSGVTAASAVATDLGSGDFTIEGSFRLLALPTGSNKSVLFGKWDEANNKRSYQLYIGGPSLEAGNTVFRISTDGTAGTVTELVSYPYTYETDTWYHVAISRTSGETLFFINGVQLGTQVTDANTYYAGTETAALGVQDNSGSQVSNTAFNGFIDEFRLTVGYARYTTSFTPPSAAFPRGSISDPHWSNVAWLSGFDSGIFDESSYARTLTAQNGSVALTPDDGTYNYQTLTPDTSGGPRDDTFIAAELLPATGVYTQTAQPSNGETVRVGTKDGTNAAIYTFKTALSTAFDVLIDTSLYATLTNLVNAINAGTGAGTKYGTGTTANYNVSAAQLPINQIEATALTPGTGGNSIASTTTAASGAWSGSTLSGGANIPGYSQFSVQRPPPETTIVDSITVLTRQFKTDAGTCDTQVSWVGPLGGVENGAINAITTTPSYYGDLFETDPDSSGQLSPTSVVNGKIKINRTG